VHKDSDRRNDKVVASGTWLYDGNVPKRIAIYAMPARYASSRWDDDILDESRPIPDTADGFLYYCWPGQSGEHLTIEAAKAWADAQPWGPIIWDSK
jgi:hypothetical protein